MKFAEEKRKMETPGSVKTAQKDAERDHPQNQLCVIFAVAGEKDRQHGGDEAEQKQAGD